MDERESPKFKVGQIVVMKNLKHQSPFRIIGMRYEDGWYYQWNRNNYAAESMIRKLTPSEVGE
jgi:hypothetical protein